MDTVNEIDDLDRQLRDAASYIDDDGFSRRVLATLPARHARRQRVRAAILLGATLVASLIAYLLSGGGQFVSQGVMRMGQLSPVVLLCVAAALGVLATGIGVIATFANNRDLQTSVWPRS
jgi:hypothetical protein